MKHFHYEEIDSTNEEAKRLLGETNESFYITAKHQTAGKGTRGRSWSSPKEKGIYLSIVHIPPKNDYFENSTLYTLASGVACIEVLKDLFSVDAEIKPINDIYFNGKKLGGILVEGRFSKEGLSYLISGIGLNIQKAEHNLDRGSVLPISLEEIIGKEKILDLNLDKFVSLLVEKNCSYFNKIKDNKNEIESKWSEYCLDV